jgi:hypothetical protein
MSSSASRQNSTAFSFGTLQCDTWEKKFLSATGFKRVGRHYRINGMEVSKTRPRGFK